MRIRALRAAYANGVTPREVVERIDTSDDSVWISRADALTAAADLPRRFPGERPPLYGIPFSVKDNIDVAGLPTTAACPDFAYTPAVSAPLVDRLVEAGAVLVGKNNLDQFATGLTGARSPYGTPPNPVDPRYVPGGSSSGSAVAVATGAVAFSIGTDTAGSGRVPAALCGVVGLKPSRGLVSTLGIVPACPSLDCPSVFAHTVADATAVLEVIAGYEPGDPWSRRLEATATAPRRVGVFDGVEADGLGVTVVPVDPEPFLAAGRLLYEAWVAERWAGLGGFVTANPAAVHPVTREVLGRARNYTAADAFAAMHRLQALKARIAPVWQDIDALMIPTVPRAYTLAEVAADPIGTNADLGRYTQFANLLDLAAIAVPAGRLRGVQFLAPAGHDRALATLAERAEATVLLAVVGAHRTGQPLHPDLAACGAVPVGPRWTAGDYRLYALKDGRPGLVRVDHDGAPVEVELHRISTGGLGALLVGVPAPLGLGRIELADGSTVVGFLAESYAVAGAEDITRYGSWPTYLATSRSAHT